MNKKKKIMAVAALGAAVTIVIGGAFAYFTDKLDGTVGGVTAGTVVLETPTVELTDLSDDPINIWNPGDLSKATITLENAGSKSVKVGYKVGIRWNPTDTQKLRQSGGQAVDYKGTVTLPNIKLYDNENKTGGAITLTASGQDDGWWYFTPDFTQAANQVALNGSEESESGITATSTTKTYYIEFDSNATNEFQEVPMQVKADAWAVQYRNTTGWTVLTDNTIPFVEAPSDVRSITP